MNDIALILDAMGVIYSCGDDVGELLVPFLRDQGGQSNLDKVRRFYVPASLGQISADDFWRGVELSADLEEEYLSLYRLSDGAAEFIRHPPGRVASLWGLSNDLERWSRRLRERNDVAEYFAGFLASGETGIRKPDPRVFELLLDRIGRPAGECVFVDDRAVNLRPAAELGLGVIQFCPAGPTGDEEFPAVASFAELAERFRKTT